MKGLLSPATIALALGFAAGSVTMTGCETSRVNKVHARIENVSDVTTTGKPQPGFRGDTQGRPPVPGSPTAAGPDGRQPLNDSEAKAGPGSEEGAPMYVTRQPRDPFERQ